MWNCCISAVIIQDDDIEDPDDIQIEDEDHRGSADDPSDEDYNPEDDGYTSNRLVWILDNPL